MPKLQTATRFIAIFLGILFTLSIFQAAAQAEILKGTLRFVQDEIPGADHGGYSLEVGTFNLLKLNVPADLLDVAKTLINQKVEADVLETTQPSVKNLVALQAPKRELFADSPQLLAQTQFRSMKSAVVLVSFPSRAPNLTFQQMVDGFTTKNFDVQQAILNQTLGTAEFIPAFYGPLSITTDPNNNCPTDDMANATYAAIKLAGIDVNTFNHLTIVFPYTQSCKFGGLAQLGGNTSWINGNDSADVLLHELGHNLGLTHSSVDRDGDGKISGDLEEYSDKASRMGSGSYKERIGFSLAHPVKRKWFEGLFPSEVLTLPYSNPIGDTQFTIQGQDMSVDYSLPRILRIDLKGDNFLTVIVGPTSLNVSDPFLSPIYLDIYKDVFQKLLVYYGSAAYQGSNGNVDGNNLRRLAALSPGETFTYLNGISIKAVSVAENSTELVVNISDVDSDSDLVPDSSDEDDDNDGVLDINDCDPTNKLRAFDKAYYDLDKDGFADRPNSFTLVACSGAEIVNFFNPPGLVIVRKGNEPFDNCSNFNPEQKDSNSNGIGDACETVQVDLIPPANPTEIPDTPSIFTSQLQIKKKKVVKKKDGSFHAEFEGIIKGSSPNLDFTVKSKFAKKAFSKAKTIKVNQSSAKLINDDYLFSWKYSYKLPKSGSYYFEFQPRNSKIAGDILGVTLKRK